ncbi:hypothetical protein HDV06_000581 [Boothiomyces sp. JEL0866]|nr:hypothetical protein HDV06_000581 [Boothiomyces sp. JEL0866]
MNPDRDADNISQAASQESSEPGSSLRVKRNRGSSKQKNLPVIVTPDEDSIRSKARKDRSSKIKENGSLKSDNSTDKFQEAGESGSIRTKEKLKRPASPARDDSESMQKIKSGDSQLRPTSPSAGETSLRQSSQRKNRKKDSVSAQVLPRDHSNLEKHVHADEDVTAHIGTLAGLESNVSKIMRGNTIKDFSIYTMERKSTTRNTLDSTSPSAFLESKVVKDAPMQTSPEQSIDMGNLTTAIQDSPNTQIDTTNSIPPKRATRESTHRLSSVEPEQERLIEQPLASSRRMSRKGKGSVTNVFSTEPSMNTDVETRRLSRKDSANLFEDGARRLSRRESRNEDSPNRPLLDTSEEGKRSSRKESNTTSLKEGNLQEAQRRLSRKESSRKVLGDRPNPLNTSSLNRHLQTNTSEVEYYMESDDNTRKSTKLIKKRNSFVPIKEVETELPPIAPKPDFKSSTNELTEYPSDQSIKKKKKYTVTSTSGDSIILSLDDIVNKGSMNTLNSVPDLSIKKTLVPATPDLIYYAEGEGFTKTKQEIVHVDQLTPNTEQDFIRWYEKVRGWIYIFTEIIYFGFCVYSVVYLPTKPSAFQGTQYVPFQNTDNSSLWVQENVQFPVFTFLPDAISRDLEYDGMHGKNAFILQGKLRQIEYSSRCCISSFYCTVLLVETDIYLAESNTVLGSLYGTTYWMFNATLLNNTRLLDDLQGWTSINSVRGWLGIIGYVLMRMMRRPQLEIKKSSSTINEAYVLFVQNEYLSRYESFISVMIANFVCNPAV